MPDPQIFNSLRGYTLVSEGDLGYRTVRRDANVGRLIKAMGMGELAHRYIPRKSARSAISKSKGR